MPTRDVNGSTMPIPVAFEDARSLHARTASERTLYAASSALLLSACGGGASEDLKPGDIPKEPPSNATPPVETPPPTESPSPTRPTPEPVSNTNAARFLMQASMGATREHIARVQKLGYAGWIDEQFVLPLSSSRWDWLLEKAEKYHYAAAALDAAAWRKMMSAPDTLRQRITLALSEIIVVAIGGLRFNGGWRVFTAGGYLDLLEANAFGNYRTLLQKVSTSPAMGEYLTFRGNARHNPDTGAMPDENYARELLQLFSIGLVELNLDGTPKLVNGAPIESYGQDDITGLARVFTGWDFDFAGGDKSTPDYMRRPMKQNPSRHENGEKIFLGKTIPAGTDGAASLNIALDWIFAHPNVAPFIGRQLIQRLVISNPSPAYVARVAGVFNNDGNGVKGNMKAVIKAVLLDEEARNASHAKNRQFGKLREPMLRFTAWARAFNATSAGGDWGMGDTSDLATGLGQSPLRSPTVFNFYRPGYVPPNSAIGKAGLVAPEFQITSETSVVGYINFMQKAVSNGVADIKADYSVLLPLADNTQALLEELNLVLAAGQLSAATLSIMRTGIDTMPRGTDVARINRIRAALVLVLASPEFIVQK